MRKTLIGIAASLAIATTALADTHATPTIQLHEKPNTHSKATGPAFKVTEPLVVILYTPDRKWAKVASRHNGSVGWLNKQEYMAAIAAKNKKVFQSIIVSTDRDQNGTVTQTVVAFRNGKQLNKVKAQQLYQKLKAHYQQQRQVFSNQEKSIRQMESNLLDNQRNMVNQFFQQPHFRERPGLDTNNQLPFGVKPQADNPWAAN